MARPICPVEMAIAFFAHAALAQHALPDHSGRAEDNDLHRDVPEDGAAHAAAAISSNDTPVSVAEAAHSMAAAAGSFARGAILAACRGGPRDRDPGTARGGIHADGGGERDRSRAQGDRPDRGCRDVAAEARQSRTSGPRPVEIRKAGACAGGRARATLGAQVGAAQGPACRHDRHRRDARRRRELAQRRRARQAGGIRQANLRCDQGDPGGRPRLTP